MFFQIKEDSIQRIQENDFWNSSNVISIQKLYDWNSDYTHREKNNIWHKTEEIHFCKAELHTNYIYITICIPKRLDMTNNIYFAIYITSKYIVILDNDGKAEKAVLKIETGNAKTHYSPVLFIYDFLMEFVKDDFIYLESIEEQLSEIEENVLSGNIYEYTHQMLTLKKSILKFYHYYIQLKETISDVSSHMKIIYASDELISDKTAIFNIFSNKLEHFTDESQLLREYAMQVQDVYHSAIEIKQNDVMKLLAMVTTIFLPLTLIAGWYGMNFEYMPEIHFKYAYPLIIVISLLTVFLSFFIFKKINQTKC